MDDELLNVEALLPQWMLDVETQAVIIAGLCCVGAWVIFQWALQIMFSVLWPFILITGLMISMPAWRKVLARDYLPRHVKTLRSFTRRFTDSFNSTYSS